MTPQEMLLFSDEEFAQEIGEWIADLRLSKNLSQAEFATKCNIPVRTYGHFERTGKIGTIPFISILRHIGKLSDIAKVMSSETNDNLINRYKNRNEVVHGRKRATGRRK